MRLKDVGYMYSGLTGKSGDDFRCEELAKTKAFVPFTNILNNFVVDFNQFKRVWMTKGEQQNQVCEGDLLFLMSSEDYESIGKSAVVIGNPGEVYLNSFCRGFRFYSYKTINPKFVNYQLSSDLYRDNLRFEARGFTRINLKVDRVESARISLPSLSEQNRIVAYLDEKTAAIDKQVSLLEQKKEKYTLLRKSIIKKAVTEGLEGETRDWNFGRLKEQIKTLESGKRPSNDKEEVLSIGGEHIQNGHFYLEHEMYVSEQTYSNSFGKIALGDILVVKDGATIGKCMYVDTMPHEKMLINEHVYRIVASKYYYYYIVSPMGQYWFRSRNMSSAQESIKQNTILNLPVPVPPLSEQRAIADYLDEKCAKIDAIVANINQQIEKYKLLRRALINEVVTGQKII